MSIQIDDTPTHEEVRIETSPNKKILIPFLLVTILLGIIPIVGWFFFGPIMLILFVRQYLRFSKTFYTVTTQRVIIAKGILRQHTVEWPLQSIGYIRTYRGIIARFFGLGDVIITWHGATPSRFRAVPGADAIANTIHSIMQQSAMSQTQNRVVIGGIDVRLRKEEIKKTQ